MRGWERNGRNKSGKQNKYVAEHPGIEGGQGTRSDVLTRYEKRARIGRSVDRSIAQAATLRDLSILARTMDPSVALNIVHFGVSAVHQSTYFDYMRTNFTTIT